MRLCKEQIEVLKSKLETLSLDAKLYLFGSRVVDTARGGDIDLVVVSDKLSEKDLKLLMVDFFKHFGEQKLDIVLDNGEFQNPFTRHIFQKAVLL